MSHNVRIYHITPMFRAEVTEETHLRLAYGYWSPNTDLEYLWRWNNLVDGNEEPARHKSRSLSVGDIVGVRSFDDKWTHHQVLGAGWQPVAGELVDQLLERGKAWDPFKGL